MNVTKMALSSGRSVCMSLLRTYRTFGAVTPWSVTRGLRSDATRLKPVASAAVTSPEPAHRLPVVEGSVVSSDDVLMVGARDFTLLGRPLLDRGLVRVDATVVEKTLSKTKRNFICIRRSRYERHYFYRFAYTILRINSIELLRDVNAPADGHDSSRSRVAY
ncbi:hypothetical protein HPB49_010352 [Dermacentor silvarum]|uniref:Uncharacterized protein n=1 Tax=Dermacentor silvarum TaxID=543639 RepID=A0ACB8C8N7_DERSI|nr:hypothetical protein HPB49_010352 [Dermacentor silvarum]